MRFFIKEWPDKAVTLLAENGTVLWTFSSIKEAEAVIQSWSEVQGDSPTYRVYHLSDNEPHSAAA